MRYLYTLLALCWTIALTAQKHDVNWLLGNASLDQYLFTFENNSPEVSILSYNEFSNLSTNITISDKSGSAVFFSNGCRTYSLSNPSFFNLINSDDYFCSVLGVGNIFYGGFSLPIPQRDNEYVIINYETGFGSPIQTYNCFLKKIIYQEINIQKNDSSMYDILSLDVLVKEGCLQKISACKHANGRDWWLIAGNNIAPVFYRWLLTPSGLEELTPQILDNPSIDSDTTLGGVSWLDAAYFSPDGTKYVISSTRAGVIYFEFDRCDGILSNPKKIHTTDEYSNASTFSPNSRFIYVLDNDSRLIYQFDTDAENISNSRTVVADWDGYLDPVHGAGTRFGGMQLGYDGKIYMWTPSPFIHVIEYPNLLGGDCSVIQRAITTPAPTSAALFNYPHYRLGPLDGTTCDSLGINNEPLAIFRYAVDDTLSPLVVSFTDASVYEPTAWHWDFGDGNTSTETNPVHTFTTPGTYTVCLIVSNAYAADTLCRTVQLGTSGLLDLPILPIAQVTPNPVTTTLRVRLPAQVGNFVPRFRVMDVWGRVVQDLALTGFDHELDMGAAPAGIYLWQLLWGDRVGQSGRVVKVAGE